MEPAQGTFNIIPYLLNWKIPFSFYSNSVLNHFVDNNIDNNNYSRHKFWRYIVYFVYCVSCCMMWAMALGFVINPHISQRTRHFAPIFTFTEMQITNIKMYHPKIRLK